MFRDLTAPPRWRVLLAFAIVYVAWGATYLAVRFGLETLPPFLLAGVRFTLAGALMLAWAWRRGSARPTRANWKAALISGALLFLVTNGGVVWAEQYVPSSIAALMLATIPLWLVLIDWLRLGAARPSLSVFAGLALGFGGVLLLVGPPPDASGGSLYMAGVLVLCVVPIGWAAGSLYSLRAGRLPASPVLATGMQLFCGGLLLLSLSVLTGELNGFNLAAVSLRSWLALAYLSIVGSIIAFSAYVWLLRVENPALVGTYAFVNPLVAVALGAWLGAELITTRMLLATALVVAGVLLITLFRGGMQAALRLRVPGARAALQARLNPNHSAAPKQQRPRA